jgi:ATP-dependent Lhr-like helicase
VVRDVLSLAPFRGISPGTLQRILDYAIERGVLISDEGVLMIGGALEEQLGIANWKDLFSLIPGGNQVPVMTSDGEEVGRLDVRFVQGRGSRGFPLGGQGWELTGVQQGSDSLTIVPAGALTGGVFWRGGGDVVSPLICRAVLRIAVRGGTLLPLGATCRDALSRAIKTLPSAMEEGQITFREEPTKNGPSVRVYTFQGARFNRVLALMIGDLLGKKVKVRYGGIAVVVHGRLGDDAVNRVAEAVAGCKSMSIGEVRAILPPPPRGTWKFSDLLPDEVREEMVCADFYHLSNFAQTLRSLVVRTAEAVYSDADEPPRSPGPRPGQEEQA